MNGPDFGFDLVPARDKSAVYLRTDSFWSLDCGQAAMENPPALTIVRGRWKGGSPDRQRRHFVGIPYNAPSSLAGNCVGELYPDEVEPMADTVAMDALRCRRDA